MEKTNQRRKKKTPKKNPRKRQRSSKKCFTICFDFLSRFRILPPPNCLTAKMTRSGAIFLRLQKHNALREKKTVPKKQNENAGRKNNVMFLFGKLKMWGTKQQRFEAINEKKRFYSLCSSNLSASRFLVLCPSFQFKNRKLGSESKIRLDGFCLWDTLLDVCFTERDVTLTPMASFFSCGNSQSAFGKSFSLSLLLFFSSCQVGLCQCFRQSLNMPESKRAKIWGVLFLKRKLKREWRQVHGRSNSRQPQEWMFLLSWTNTQKNFLNIALIRFHISFSQNTETNERKKERETQKKEGKRSSEWNSRIFRTECKRNRIKCLPFLHFSDAKYRAAHSPAWQNVKKVRNWTGQKILSQNSVKRDQQKSMWEMTVQFRSQKTHRGDIRGLFLKLQSTGWISPKRTAKTKLKRMRRQRQIHEWFDGWKETNRTQFQFAPSPTVLEVES